jgi:hypothetical protein
VGTIYDPSELPGVSTVGPGIGWGVTPGNGDKTSKSFKWKAESKKSPNNGVNTPKSFKWKAKSKKSPSNGDKTLKSFE